MTDFINYPNKKIKIQMSESTGKIVKEIVDDEELSEEDFLRKINESKKVVAKKTKNGIKIKQSLNG